MPVEITKIRALNAHLRFNVGDLERSIEFYQKMFGVEPDAVRTGCAKFKVSNPPLNLTLNQVSPGQLAPMSLGIQISSARELKAMRDRWIELGLIVCGEKNGGDCPASQNKIRINDPDGNGWRFFAASEDGFAEAFDF